jgi:hypothetical protein
MKKLKQRERDLIKFGLYVMESMQCTGSAYIKDIEEAADKCNISRKELNEVIAPILLRKIDCPHLKEEAYTIYC